MRPLISSGMVKAQIQFGRCTHFFQFHSRASIAHEPRGVASTPTDAACCRRRCWKFEGNEMWLDLDEEIRFRVQSVKFHPVPTRMEMQVTCIFHCQSWRLLTRHNLRSAVKYGTHFPVAEPLQNTNNPRNVMTSRTPPRQAPRHSAQRPWPQGFLYLMYDALHAVSFSHRTPPRQAPRRSAQRQTRMRR